MRNEGEGLIKKLKAFAFPFHSNYLRALKAIK